MTHRHRRRHTAVAMFLLLALVATLTACSEGGTPLPTGLGAGSDRSSAQGPVGGSSQAEDAIKLRYAAWKGRGQTAPDYAVVLISETQLPSEYSLVKDEPELLSGSVSGYTGVRRGLNQLQDRSVTVTVPIFNQARSDYSDDALLIATIDQQGALLSSTRYDWPAADRPEPFDLARKATDGYARVVAAEGSGITIPSAAAGDRPEKVYITSIMGDAFDDKLLWAMVRGSSSVYKAQIQKLGE